MGLPEWPLVGLSLVPLRGVEVLNLRDSVPCFLFLPISASQVARPTAVLAPALPQRQALALSISPLVVAWTAARGLH